MGADRRKVQLKARSGVALLGSSDWATPPQRTLQRRVLIDALQLQRRRCGLVVPKHKLLVLAPLDPHVGLHEREGGAAVSRAAPGGMRRLQSSLAAAAALRTVVV